MTVIEMVGCVLQKLAKVLENQELILERLASTNATQASILARLDKLQSTVDLIDAAVFQPDQVAGISLTITTITTKTPVAPAETET